MKKIVRISIITIIFISAGNSIYSQSLKKAFKLFDDKKYNEAYKIFISGKNMNSCIGIYGEALILNKKPVISKNGESDEAHFKRKMDKKLLGYSKVIQSEKMIGEVSDKELKSLKDYFSVQKISDLKKEIEANFLKADMRYFDVNFLQDLKDTCKGNEFYTSLENNYISYRFNELKKIISLSIRINKAEHLIEINKCNSVFPRRGV